MDLIGSTSGDNVGVASPERAGPTAKSRKRVRLDSEGETFDADPVAGEDTHSNQSGGPEDGYYGDERGRSPLEEQPRAVGSKFSEKQVEEYQLPWQPSATPKFLQHRFMVSDQIFIQWNLLIRTPSGTAILSLVERLSSVIFYRESTFSLSFVGRFVLFRNVLYRRFPCTIAQCPIFSLTSLCIFCFQGTKISRTLEGESIFVNLI